MKLDLQMFGGETAYEFIVSKQLIDDTVQVTLTPNTTGITDTIDDNCTFENELVGWEKCNDGKGSIRKVYSQNTSEVVSVVYICSNTNTYWFETNVIVTEIGGIYEPYTWKNDEEGDTPVSAENLNHMEIGIYNVDKTKISKTVIELLSVSDTAPTTCSTGDMYYNTTTNLIYTATDTNTWGTTGVNPVSTYLYVDLTNSKLYYYDGTNFKSYGGGSGSINVNNDKSTSTTETYSCNYVNKFDDIGTVVNFFGDVMGSDGTYNVSCYSKVTATKISADGIWKFDIQGKMVRDETVASDYYIWGFRADKISALLNNKIGKQVQIYDGTLLNSSWFACRPDGTTQVPYTDRMDFGTVLENNDNNLLPARYYLANGSIGGFRLDLYANNTYFEATIYLKEV